MPQGNPEGYRYQRRPRHDSDESTELLKLALLEQEQTRPGSSQFRPGETPSNLAINAYLSTIPLSREQNREQDILDEMDRRYFQSREDRRAIDSQLEAQKGGATARQFAMRRGVEEDPGMLAGSPDPSQMRTIRRFSESARPVDPDAAMTASQRAAIDPRVVAAGITAQGRLAAEQAKAGTKAAAEKAKADEKKAETAESDAARQQTKDEIIRLANEVYSHQALGRNIGPIDAAFPTMTPGGSDFQTKLQRLRDLIALENRSKLKGQGAVSDFEGKMLASASTALNPYAGEAAFQEELRRIAESQGGKIGGGRKVGRFVISE